MIEPSAPQLVLDRVVKRFDTKTAVAGVSLGVGAGTIFGLLGRNGAGKTTTLRMIAGILVPDEGTVRLFGDAPPAAARHRLGYLPEERGLYKKMKVREQVAFFAEIKGRRGSEAAGLTRSILERFELAADAERKVEELSKGNQQKVQLACVLVADPDLLILDEPMSGLDPVNVVLVREVLRWLRGRGKTVVLSTHMMSEAEKLCDEVALIHDGKVVLEGSVREVRHSRGENAVHLEVEREGVDFAALPGVLRARVSGRSAELRIDAGADTNALVAAVLACGRIRRFEVAAPSLEEVFVDQVGAPAASPQAAS